MPASAPSSKQMKHRHPLAETYIQNLKTDKDSVVVPNSDQYFLGRLDLSDGVEDQLFEKQTGLKLKALNPFPSLFSRKFLPLGFAQMVMLDRDFQKKNYDFKFVRQEFLGEVRCIVLDVQPKGDEAAASWAGSGLKITTTISSASTEPTPRIPATATTCISIAGA